MHDQQIASIEAWIAMQDGEMSRPEAIGRLVELGLTVKAKPKQPAAWGAKRANTLATKAIDRIIDPSAPPEERAQRRHQLTKGPSEFREDRIDLPKAKGK